MSRSLLDHYVEATEWNLATLEELVELKSSSRHRIARQVKICADMLQICDEYCGSQYWDEKCALRSRPIRTIALLEQRKNSNPRQTYHDAVMATYCKNLL